MSKQILLPSEMFRLRSAKFPKGKEMTIDEVAEVVGPEFKEMNVNPPPEVVDTKNKMQGKKAYVQNPQEVQPFLLHILAALRAQYLMYQTSHWQTKGPAYYGNHLLFQRLYESAQGEIDAVAEKLVGYTGAASVGLPAQIELIERYCSRWCAVENLHERGLVSEKEVQKLLKFTYDTLKAKGELTLGLDDWLMATSSAHETNVYLLQQVLS